MPERYIRGFKYGMTVVIMIVLGISMVSTGLFFRDQNKYPGNYVIGEYYLDSADIKTVQTEIPGKIEATYGNRFVLVLGDGEDPSILMAEDSGWKYDFALTISRLDNEIFQPGIWGILNHSLIRGSLDDHQVLPVIVISDRAKLVNILQNLKHEYDCNRSDAKVYFADNSLHYIDGQEGRKLNIDGTIDSMIRAMSCGKLEASASIDIEAVRISSEDSRQICDLLGVSAGSLDISEVQAMGKVNEAKNKINGLILKNGDSLQIIQAAGGGSGQAESVDGTAGIGKVLAEAANDAGLEITSNESGLMITNHRSEPVMLWLANDDHMLIARVFGKQTEAGKSVSLDIKPDSNEPGRNHYYKVVSIAGQDTVATPIGEPQADHTILPDQPKTLDSIPADQDPPATNNADQPPRLK